MLVEESAFDRFMALFEEHVRAIRVGDPLDPATEMGPLISAAQRDAVASFLDDGDPVVVPRQRARRPRLLVCADDPRARSRATRA